MTHRTAQSGREMWAAVAPLLLLLTAGLFFRGVPAAEGKGVHVTVVAPWTETAFLQEGCEWAATRGAAYGGFYQCLRDVWRHVEGTNDTGGAATLTQKVQHDVVMRVMAGAGMTSSQLRLLEIKLAARAHSPAVEAHWQMSRTAIQLAGGCAADGRRPFALIAGKAICDADVLDRTLATHANEDRNDAHEMSLLFLKLDHIHPKSTGHQIVILYGIVGEERTMRLFHTLERHLHATCLAFRHLPLIGSMWERPLYVQGYGVTVDLKNLEYKVMNDENNTSEAGTDVNETNPADESEGVESVGGFDVRRLKERYPQLEKQLNSFKDYLVEIRDRAEVKADFEVWETQYMGIAAAQYVMDASNEKRLETLKNVLTEFPFYASRLSKMGASANAKMSSSMRGELSNIENMRLRGLPPVFFNGRSVGIQEIGLFSLLEKLEGDEQMFEDMKRVITSYRVPSAKSVSFASSDSDAMGERLNGVTQQLHGTAMSTGSSSDGSKTRLWISAQTIFWLNDIEKDLNYAHMPHDLDAILNVGFNNVPIFPRKNIFHVVCILDPTTVAGLQSLAMLLRLEENRQPFRMGIVFADTKWSPTMEASTTVTETLVAPSLSTTTALIAATVWELVSGGDRPPELLEFLGELIATGEKHGSITESDLESATRKALSDANRRDVSSVITDPEFLKYYQETQAMLRAFQLKEFPVTLINGDIFYEGVINALQNGFGDELRHLRRLVETGMLVDGGNNLYDSIMQLNGARRRYRASLYENKIYVDWTSTPVLDFLHYRPFLSPASHSGDASLVSSVLLLQSSVRSESVHALLKAVKQLAECDDDTQNCGRVRFTYAFCGLELRGKRRTMIGDMERLLLSLESDMKLDKKQKAKLMYEFVSETATRNDVYPLDDPDAYERVLAHTTFSSELQKLLDTTAEVSDIESQLQQQRALVDGFCAQMEAQSVSLGSLTVDATSRRKTEGAVYYYANGRRFLYDDTFAEEDFADAALQEMSLAEDVLNVLTRANLAEVSKELQQAGLDNHFFASKVAALTALLKRSAVRGNSIKEEEVMPPAPGPASFIVQPVNASTTPRHRLTVVIDPIAQQSQLLVSLCDYFARSQLGVSCTVYLSSIDVSKSKPMRSFYQFVGDTQVRFDAAGSVLSPAAIFHRLPSHNLLTVGVEEPEGWTVFSFEAAYDLDNILLHKLPPTSQYLHATYRINSILVSGTAKEAGLASAPSGLPLLMRSSRGNISAGVTRDTLVTANLGYFQLQGTPGVWYLSVKPGEIAKVFYISRVNDVSLSDEIKMGANATGEHSARQSIPVVVSSFTGEWLALDVAKAPGQERRRIEEFMKVSARRTDWPPKGPRETKPERPTLNIFSVVSGHLYERFLRMMIHSVMKTSSDIHGANTTRIKFWFIENFLSPQFRKTVPLLAKHYGFDVGFVTYRWPWWLNKQVEKQRIIWAYKILFLDVLFPLDLDRIIFIDADQKVFVDMHELYNMDIGNAPMAYTPFCRRNPNKATKNFRFWEQGFWRSHLRGRPYHISALYLVDLRQLRAIAGGERYRIVYSQLSRDANSLANLDQDLPNFMQDDVPIYSLPEEWLWCETWCGMKSKAKAKTIDLCNNPLTKIPKLENAKKILPGWEELDEELEALSRKLLRDHQPE